MRKRPPTPPGDLLSRLKDVFDQLAQTATTLSDSAGAQGEAPFTVAGKTGRMVFGYTMRMGLDGLQAEPFGDVPARAPKPGAKAAAPSPAARAPIVDVFEEAETIRIIAELPGVGAEDVTCTLEGSLLRIETRGGHLYAKTVPLPGPVDAATLVHSCRNGILEISVARRPAP
jgi:HSP20 family protein